MTIKAQNLVGHWLLDETSVSDEVKDISGNNNNGTSSETSISYNRPFNLTSKNFDGTDDTIVFDLITTKINNLAISAWFKTNDYTQNRQVIFYNGNGDSDGYGITVNFENETSGVLRVLFGGVSWFTTGINITDNNWHHVVLTLSDATPPEKNVYLDGSNIFTNTSGTPNTPTTATRIGNDNSNSGTPYFNGNIADIRFYDRELSVNEVEAIYNGGSPAQSSLIGHWLLNDSLNLDYSGNGNNGTAQGANGSNNLPQPVNDLPIKISHNLKSKNFDGTDDQITIGNDSSFNPTNFSITGWFNCALIPEGDFYQEVIAKNSSDSQSGYEILLSRQSSLLGLYFYTNNGSWTSIVFENPTVNTWYNFAAIFSTTNGKKLYINNALVASDPNVTSYTSSTANLLIGNGFDNTRFFNGNIADIRFYDKELSVNEVEAIYNGGFPAQSNLIGHWKLDEMNTSDTIVDYSGNGNDGTAQGATGSNNLPQPSLNIPSVFSGISREFDGNDDYIQVSNDSSLDFSGAISWCAWVYKYQNIPFARIVDKGNTEDASIRYFFGFDDPGSGLALAVDSTTNFYTSASGVISNNQWFHIAATFNGSVYTSYVNGTSYTPAESSTWVASSDDNLYIGQRLHETLPRRYNGLICDLRIYKSVLTQFEVNAIIKGDLFKNNKNNLLMTF